MEFQNSVIQLQTVGEQFGQLLAHLVYNYGIRNMAEII